MNGKHLYPFTIHVCKPSNKKSLVHLKAFLSLSFWLNGPDVISILYVWVLIYDFFNINNFLNSTRPKKQSNNSSLHNANKQKMIQLISCEMFFLKFQNYSGIRTLNHSSIYFAYYSMNAAKITGFLLFLYFFLTSACWLFVCFSRQSVRIGWNKTPTKKDKW